MLNRFFIPLLLLGCFMLTPSLADTMPERGVLDFNKEKRLPVATPEQVDEALAVSQDCARHSRSSTYFDCDCVGMKFLELRRAAGDKAHAPFLLIEAEKSCPNMAGIAGQTYERCLAWGPQEIGYNYKEFCSCFGSEYGRIYGKNPTSNLMHREAQMTDAMTKCKYGDIKRQADNYDSWIEQLKQKGLYKSLFPGSDEQ